MKHFTSRLFKTTFWVALTMLVSISTYSLLKEKASNPAPKVKSSYSPKAAATSAEDREAFFFRAFRDPSINAIPEGIRSMEQQLYEDIRRQGLKSTLAGDYTWSEVGPNDVGGRTRALAIDVRNSNTLLAGGVSGGVWKSTDKGLTWSLKTTPDESFSVTSICQDTRTGYQDTWYYVGGEFSGNSANAGGASYYGHGLYMSVDNGETWNPIQGTSSSQYKWDDWMDFVSKVKIDPTNGRIVLAVHGYGIMVVINNGGTFELYEIIGNPNDHYYSDFDFDASGNLILVLSESGFNTPPESDPGIYYRAVGTSNLVKIDPTLPEDFPTEFDRSLIRFAPSDNTMAYVYTVSGSTPYFHAIDIVPGDLSSSTIENRTSNLPGFGELGKQGSYNMTLAVKPDDSDFVIIGSTSLFRSNDAFVTTPTEDYGWIGGYGPDNSEVFTYTNHHPDCHITLFDPASPNAVWSGHDGGLSYLADITQSLTLPDLLPWVDMNNGYNITQFYTLAEPTMANEDRYLGGTQDNGSPYFKTMVSAGSTDISSGDGAYCQFGENFAYISSQNGNVLRTGYNSNGDPLNPFAATGPYDWSQIKPTDATGQLFINPFCINTNGDPVMYYAGGEQLWINENVDDIPSYLSGGTMVGWSSPAVLNTPNEDVTAIAISKVPAHVLYYATYTGSTPKLYRVDNSIAEEENLVRQDKDLSIATAGSYPYFIAINPNDAEELIVVFSNYGVPSLLHSMDGGDNFTIIDGNLTATSEVPGPSIRSAAILEWGGETTYFISTSIGVYSTSVLNGASTTWANVDHNNLGNVVSNRVKASEYDGKVIIATHGRGIFKGELDNTLYINKKIKSINALTSSPDEVIDISDVFAHSSGSAVNTTIQSNTVPAIASAVIDGDELTIDFSDTMEGTTVITLQGSAGTDLVYTSFSVSVEEDPATAIDELPAIEESTDEELKLYPNPSDGHFQINAGTAPGACSVNIYDLSGALVFSKSFNDSEDVNAYNFNISTSVSGSYIVVMKTAQFTKKWKIYKK